MITRHEVLAKAVDECLKELYLFAQPRVAWEEFINENKVYSNKYKAWERYITLKNKPDLSEKELAEYSQFPANWANKSITECIGPKPFEFYYLPKEILNDICQSYIDAYQIDSQNTLLNIILLLKDYCKSPIVDKYIDSHEDEYGIYHPGYKSYDHPDNLEKELYNLIPDSEFNKSEIAEELQNKFFEFLDMAGNFYNWNRDLNSFNASVYLGPSPNSNKEKVIENWKKYRHKDIEIDEEQIKKDYYGEE